MTQQEMMLLVPRKLKEIEKEYGIRILYAAESGSRAWGTNSESSDYDIRFIYIRPRVDYLRLQPYRDVLEFPIDDSWDMCGWDLAKTLRLLHSSNTQIYEWFASPVVYLDEGFSQRFRPVLKEYFSVKTGVYHYLHQSEMKTKQRLRAEAPKVKHYLYSLQHTASALWVLEQQAPAVISYHKIVELLPEDLRREAQAMLLRKITRRDQPFMEISQALEDRLLEEKERITLQLKQMPQEPEKSWDMLDRFFLEELARLEEA